MKKQAGFTLIELIMVIVILGVLSAFALPRFADFGGDARTASVNALAGAMRSAANIAHAQWLADGGTGTTVDLDGATGIAMSNGFPTTAGIAIAAQVDGSYLVSDAGTVRTYYISPDDGTAAAANVCRVTYTEATATASPAVAVTTTGC